MEEPKESVFDARFKLKDVAQWVGLIIGGTVFIVTMNAKIDKLTDAITDLRDNGSKNYATQDLSIRALQNQVSTNSVQIELIKKDIDILKLNK